MSEWNFFSFVLVVGHPLLMLLNWPLCGTLWILLLFLFILFFSLWRSVPLLGLLFQTCALWLSRLLSWAAAEEAAEEALLLRLLSELTMGKFARILRKRHFSKACWRIFFLTTALLSAAISSLSLTICDQLITTISLILNLLIRSLLLTNLLLLLASLVLTLSIVLGFAKRSLSISILKLCGHPHICNFLFSHVT